MQDHSAALHVDQPHFGREQVRSHQSLDQGGCLKVDHMPYLHTHFLILQEGRLLHHLRILRGREVLLVLGFEALLLVLMAGTSIWLCINNS